MRCPRGDDVDAPAGRRVWASEAFLDEVEVVESPRPIGESSHFLSKLLCLREPRLLHRGFVGVEHHGVEVAVRVVAVLAQEATASGPLPFGPLAIAYTDSATNLRFYGPDFVAVDHLH